MIHTGSLKILDGFKNIYKLKDNQVQESYETLHEYGNLTGVSIPTVMDKDYVSTKQHKRKRLVNWHYDGFWFRYCSSRKNLEYSFKCEYKEII